MENKYLERAKKEYKTCSEEEKLLLERVFPELLQERGDDGVRKGLINHLNELKDWKPGEPSPIKIPEVYAVWLNYLEGNKEDYSGFSEEQMKYMKKYINLDKVTLIKMLGERDQDISESVENLKNNDSLENIIIGVRNKLRHLDKNIVDKYANFLLSIPKMFQQDGWKASLKTADLENSLCDLQDGFSDTSHEYRILGEAIEYIRRTQEPDEDSIYKLYIARDRAAFEDEAEEEWVSRHPEIEHTYGRLRLFYEKPELDGETGIWKGARTASEVKNYMFPELRCEECMELSGRKSIQEHMHYPGAVHVL